VVEGIQTNRMCSLTIECVLLLQNVFSHQELTKAGRRWRCVSYYRMCSLTIECVLLLQYVFSLGAHQGRQKVALRGRVHPERWVAVHLCKRTHSIVREHIL